jgi:hypothetical protein
VWAGEAFDHLDQIRVLCCIVSATEHNCFGDRTGLLNRPRMLKMQRVKNKHRPKTERHGSPAGGSDGEGVVVSGKSEPAQGARILRGGLLDRRTGWVSGGWWHRSQGALYRPLLSKELNQWIFG